MNENKQSGIIREVLYNMKGVKVDMKRHLLYSKDRTMYIDLDTGRLHFNHPNDKATRDIPSHAFRNSFELRRVVIPTGVVSIPDRAFENCVNLEEVVLPNTLHCIRAHTFANCTKLKHINLPEGMVRLTTHVFANCVSLTHIDIPSTIRYICERAFDGCCGLIEIKLPVGLKQISHRSFKDCISLETINLPESLEMIGNEAFSGCTNLTGCLNISDKCKNVGLGVFRGVDKAIITYRITYRNMNYDTISSMKLKTKGK